MHKKLAKRIAKSLSRHRGSTSTFLTRRISSHVAKGTTFRYVTDAHKILAAFHISYGDKEHWLLFTNLRQNRPDNFYMIVYPFPRQAQRSLAEIHKVSDSGTELQWTYNPGTGDERHERECRFIEMYGTTEIRLSIPDDNIITAEDFLRDLLLMIEIRETAHNLEAEILWKDDDTFPEGRRIQRIHTIRERSPRLVRQAKKRHAERHDGNLPCEVCGFDYKKQYGPRGEEFIEAHHKLPLSVSDKADTCVEHLALVCANCHRMLHRKPWMSVDELRALLAEREVRREEDLPEAP